MKPFLAALLAALIVSPPSGQGASVSGFVIDLATGEPRADVRIELRDSYGLIIREVEFIKADDRGYFEFTHVVTYNNVVHAVMRFIGDGETPVHRVLVSKAFNVELKGTKINFGILTASLSEYC